MSCIYSWSEKHDEKEDIQLNVKKIDLKVSKILENYASDEKLNNRDLFSLLKMLNKIG